MALRDRYRPQGFNRLRPQRPRFSVRLYVAPHLCDLELASWSSRVRELEPINLRLRVVLLEKGLGSC